ncbi:MAG: YceI family protein [Saprospiraceae bacterium]
MKNFLVLIGMLFLTVQYSIAQKYFTKTAVVSFESSTPLENIVGINKSGTCVVDFVTGNIEFAVLIKGFQFEKALMQEHFNENYMESSKFSKANFKGKLIGFDKIVLTKNGKHKVKVDGKLTIHGVTKQHTSDVMMEVKDGKVISSTNFNVAVADYDISIPSLVKDNIAKNVAVSVQGTLETLK